MYKVGWFGCTKGRRGLSTNDNKKSLVGSGSDVLGADDKESIG